MRFNVYHDDNKSTSGRRFFAGLARLLAAQKAFSDTDYDVILCNVSVPIRRILFERLRGRRVVLRVDGLYFDRLSDAHLARLRWPFRAMLKMARRLGGDSGWPADVANFVNENWVAFIRIVLANHIVYQSSYSRKVYQRYFPHKPNSVVANGERFRGEAAKTQATRPTADGRAIRVLVTFDEWRPSKRMGETIEFVRWANEDAGIPLHLTILGYTGSFSADTAPTIKAIAEGRDYISLLPRFREYEGEALEALREGDLYLTFSYRDACPNVVVEAMAHNLPVVAIDSGGLADIVGDAGVLIPGRDTEGFFAPARFDGGFPVINFLEVLEAVRYVAGQSGLYRARVRQRFADDLGMEIVAGRYFEALKAAAQ